MAFFDTVSSWLHLDTMSSLLQIIVTDIALSADNALVIAVICQNLPPPIQKISIILGVTFAIVFRIVLTIFVAQFIHMPVVQGLAGIALCMIAVKLITSHRDKKETTRIAPQDRFLPALGMIAVVDLIMSLDNVMSIATIAGNNKVLLVLGLIISIPLVAISSQFFLRMIERFPYIIDAGAAILGYVGGRLLMTDPFFMKTQIMPKSTWVVSICSVLMGALVVLLGKLIQRHRKKMHSH